VLKKILVVEDENSIAEMLKLNLELENFIVNVISNGRAALDQQTELEKFDLVILDIMLPEISGLDICRAYRLHSNVPILFLSAKGNTNDRVAGLKMGANDYLPKPFDLEELLLRVNILIGRNFIEEEVKEELQLGKKTINFLTFEVFSVASKEVSVLSKKEIDLLQLFTKRRGEVITRDEILDEVWGKDQFPTPRTIDNYILNFRKLFEEDAKNPQFFFSIRGVGYKMQ
jgi:two-component system, OmpR family, alkaline phosphatase synthesis response regulator PhoP